jgi:hypothetical protein
MFMVDKREECFLRVVSMHGVHRMHFLILYKRGPADESDDGGRSLAEPPGRSERARRPRTLVSRDRDAQFGARSDSEP